MRTLIAIRVLLALGVLVCGPTGCGTHFTRGNLEPTARVPVDRPIYVQVREIGVAVKVVYLRFENRAQLAATIDVQNRSPIDVTIDTAHARLRWAGAGRRSWLSARAVAAGPGGLPARIALGAKPPSQVPLRPGQSETFWIVFEEWPEGAVGRTDLSLPVHGQQGTTNVEVVIADPSTGEPAWKFPPTPTTALVVRAFTHDLGLDSDAFASGAFGLGLWHARGPWKLGVGGADVRLVSREETGYLHVHGFMPEVDLAWRPTNWAIGLFTSGHLTVARLRPGESLRSTPGLSIGVEAAIDAAAVPLATFRAGYTHLFDSGLAASDGVFMMLEARLWRW